MTRVEDTNMDWNRKTFIQILWRLAYSYRDEEIA